ncbi:MAG: radical SAM family heme chaperone HemW [Anaerolineaceae bacterium]|nr:radical SAM family heme chaperone HemW [Anaerolineaceae bacterium]
MDLYSLYLHVPFCRHRCSYCDFNTFAGQNRWIPLYVEALCREIQQVSSAAPERIPVHTVFFGGGTPSLLEVGHFSAILSTLRQSFDFQPEVEVTIEANPGTVTARYLNELRQVGVNRLSFGMQSAHPDDLRLLERQHDFFDVVQAVRWARQAGFTNLSLDLIFGLPGQSLERWRETLERALGMQPEHLSLYALTIEHGTPLQRRWGRGMVPLVDDDLAAEMYEHAMDRLETAGFTQYEISNWARSENSTLYSCKHNLQYWHNQPYFGFGAGAHGFAGGARTMNVGGIKPFINRCQVDGQAQFPAGPAARRTISIDRFTEMQETMMVGLRLTQDGVSSLSFQQRFHQSLEDCFGEQIKNMQKVGLLEWTDEMDPHLRLTRRGRLLGNQVFMQFVG